MSTSSTLDRSSPSLDLSDPCIVYNTSENAFTNTDLPVTHAEDQSKQDSNSTPKCRSYTRDLLQCAVCGAGTHYSYYNAIVCDPCRTFFRRHVLSKRVSLNSKFAFVVSSLFFSHRSSSVSPERITVSSRTRIAGSTVVFVDSTSVSK